MRQRARPTTKADETPQFVEFWEQVWKPVMNPNDGRGAARDEFFRHVEEYGADPRDLIDGARWFVRKGGNKDWKLHAATWLNRRAYEDFAEMERAYQRQLQERESGNVVNIGPRYQRPANHFLNQYKG